MFDKLIDFFSHKRVLILGFGLEGKSTLEILKKIPCTIGISDICLNITDEIRNYELYSGENYLLAVDNFDIVMKAPGVILLDKLNTEQKEKITSQTDLLLRFTDNTVVGITGTKGKSTTSSLIHHLVPNSILIGNIGIPPLEKTNKLDKNTTIICEMSCHQLEYVRASPNIAVLLNVYEEHLDHYVNFDAYKRAKENIYLYQKENDLLIYNTELTVDTEANKFTASLSGKADIYLDNESLFIEDLIIPLSDIKTKLYGRHNLYNIGIAIMVALRLGVGLDDVLSGIESFSGLPHRLEVVGSFNGVEYINDSISTMPLAAISAVESFPETDTLIIGGMDRGIDYQPLIEYINSSDLQNIITLPDTGHKISGSLSKTVYKASDMAEAVEIAANITKKRCILSPAAASYGFYKNFEARGTHFKELVKEALTK